MSTFDGWTLEQLRERARLNRARGIRVSPELTAAIVERTTRNRTWANDAIQFPRLLAEIRAIGLTAGQYQDLALSMDLTNDQIDELLERAETAWQAIKEAT